MLFSEIIDMKKIDEDVKKAKRRQYQSKRKQTTGKDTPTPKKRPRKAGKPEEDYDGYIESLMTQLRQLPPIGIVEPKLSHTHNVCPVFGTGDFSKLNTKDYSTRLGDLNGTFGHCLQLSGVDFYGSKPFGKNMASSKTPPASSHRGFYHQEFASPKTSSGNN
jgi:histone-lysine N-methyltransferase MLL3